MGLGLAHSCTWPQEGLSSERLSLALASEFFCVCGLGLGLEPCILDSTFDYQYSMRLWIITIYRNRPCICMDNFEKSNHGLFLRSPSVDNFEKSNRGLFKKKPSVDYFETKLCICVDNFEKVQIPFFTNNPKNVLQFL